MFSRVSVSASLARPSVAVAAAAGGVAEAATRTLATANINFTEPPAASAKPETKVRVGELENGVRVAAIEGGPSSTVGTVGVFVGSGSRDETTATSGAAHFNKALAYRATEDNTYFLAIRTLEATGAQVSTTSSREATIYTADVLKPHTPTVLSVMADTILNAKVQLYEIEDARAVVGHETHQAMTHGPTFVSERLHATAYGSANLGLPAFCPPEQVNRLARDDLVAFRNGAHVANNIVVAGVGIDFDDLANVAGGVFGGAEGTKQARSKASYTGGSSYTSAPGMTHLAVGFESVASTAGADLFALGVLQNHVARAVSAAVAGIDGAHGATAGLSAYTDSGLFGVSAAGEAAAMGAVADALVGVLQATKKNLSAADLTQAQNNATADYLMAVEARGTRFEDLGAQVLAGGAFLSPSAVVKGISEVTAASVAKVAKQVLASVPTVVAHGDHSHVPSYANISAQLK